MLARQWNIYNDAKTAEKDKNDLDTIRKEKELEEQKANLALGKFPSISLTTDQIAANEIYENIKKCRDVPKGAKSLLGNDRCLACTHPNGSGEQQVFCNFGSARNCAGKYMSNGKQCGLAHPPIGRCSLELNGKKCEHQHCPYHHECDNRKICCLYPCHLTNIEHMNQFRHPQIPETAFTICTIKNCSIYNGHTRCTSFHGCTEEEIAYLEALYLNMFGLSKSDDSLNLSTIFIGDASKMPAKLAELVTVNVEVEGKNSGKKLYNGKKPHKGKNGGKKLYNGKKPHKSKNSGKKPHKAKTGGS